MNMLRKNPVTTLARKPAFSLRTLMTTSSCPDWYAD
jgi:hypothetical protein